MSAEQADSTPKAAVARVVEALRFQGFSAEVVEFPVSTRTAAGAPNSVFGLAPAELIRVSGGELADIKEERG